MEQKALQELLEKHAEGTLSAAEQQRLDQWYSDFDQPEDKTVIFKDDAHQEQIYHRLLQRIYSGLGEEVLSAAFTEWPAKKDLKLSMRFWFRMAAIFAFFSLSIPLYLFLLRSAPEKQGLLPVAMSFSKTPVGKLLELTLEDGSVIVLNAATTLKYPKHFTGKTREVYLEGEAFFRISSNPQKPFIVHSGALTTRVLGTSFNIRAYPGMDQIKVNVATGKVGVQLAKKNIGFLLPNQQLRFDTVEQVAELSACDAALAGSWQKGTIRLDGVSFDELAAVIRNTYGYELESTRPSVRKTSFKITFNSYDKIDAVMRAISRIPDAKYRIKEKKINMY